MSVTAAASANPSSGNAPLTVVFLDASTVSDVIVETGSAPDTITETGSQSDTVTEGA